jgi:hypothetical protein
MSPKASDLSLDSQTSILLKGPFGHAKTCAAATFAIAGPIYIAYWDKKKPVELEHFFKVILKRPELLSRIEYDVYGAHNAHEYLNKMISLARECRYVAVITDSVTQLTSGAVNWSLSFRDDRKNKEKLKVIPDFDEYKVETSLVTQSLDISRNLPCHVIWTCHPVPSIKIEGAGASIKVTKTHPIVTYGSKVAGIVPGQFSEIYHFSKISAWDSATGKASTKYVVDTDAIGDDFAKSNIGLTGQMDITNQPFYEIWKEKIKILKEDMNEVDKQTLESNQRINPFAAKTETKTTDKTWNSEKGVYE